MNALIFTRTPLAPAKIFIPVLMSLFFVPEKASACSWDVWPCFGKAKISGSVFKTAKKRKTYYRTQRSASRKYYRRVAALKKLGSTGRSLGRRTIGRLTGRSRPNRRKYLPILKRVKPRGLPMALAVAVVTVESNWRAEVTGSVGEVGLMQLRAATARWMGGHKVRRAKKADIRRALFKPEFNLRIGTKYLYWCYRRARGNVAATIGCYNRGPGRMWVWHKNAITKRYVTKVRRLISGRGQRG